MKPLFAICMLTFSTITLADVTADDIRNAASARNSACTSGSDRDCSKAVQQEQAIGHQLNKEISEQMNRTPEENQRRNQIMQEEKWRDEYRNK